MLIPKKSKKSLKKFKKISFKINNLQSLKNSNKIKDLPLYFFVP